MASAISFLNINPSPIISHHQNFKMHYNYNTTKRASLPTTWREIQGSNNWKNLTNPLNPLLQSEIIRYGELLSACYKVFDIDPSSNRHHSCKYGKNSMFKSIRMESSGYHVSKYVYATPGIAIHKWPGTCTPRWIGYVAVSSDEGVRRLGRRDLLVCFRGTVTGPEWIANMMISLTPARLDPNDERNDVKVESGFLSLYTCDDSTCKFGHRSCREQLLSEVSRILNKYKGEEISITLAGHSMGSSLALLLGYDLAELGLNRVNGSNNNPIPITVFSFGGPRVGNHGFKKRCEELDVKVLRVVNVNDPITKMPGVLLNENFRVLGGVHCYAHVGVELALNFFKMEKPTCVHDLDAYINGLLKCNKLLMQRKRKRLLDIVTRANAVVRKHKSDAARQFVDLGVACLEGFEWIFAIASPTQGQFSRFILVYLLQSLRLLFKIPNFSIPSKGSEFA